MVQLLSKELVAIASRKPDQHADSVEAMPADDAAPGIPPQMPTPAQELLGSIRIGWRDLAAETARNIQRLSQATVEQALEMGQQLWRMQRDLKRKEYSTFLSVLGWASAKARKFINLAKIFAGFKPSQLIEIEITTLLSLCSKRYSAVVEQLRDVQDVTQQLVEQLIKETKAPKQLKSDPISGWKRNRSGGGRRYEVILHDEQTGVSIEQQALAEAILPHRVIQEAVALRLKSKTDQDGNSAIVVKQVLEQQDEQEQISALRQQIEAEAQQQARNRFEMLEFDLKQKIAHLEAQLAAVKPSELGAPPTATTGVHSVQAPEATLESTPRAVTDDAVAPEPMEDSIATIVTQSSEAEPVSSASTTTVTDDVVAPELVSSPSTTTIPQNAVAQEPVSEASLTEASEDSATSKQLGAADWDMLQQLRAAESSLRKIDKKIQGLNSQLAQSGLNVVEREIKPVIKQQQNLRSTIVEQIVALIDSNFIPAYYEEQQNSCRVVLDAKYASNLLLQAQSWADVVLVVGSSSAQLVNAVKEWSKESKQLLVQLLSSHLETEPDAFEQIDWLPKKLLSRALSSLSFTVQKIKKCDNLVDEPEMECLTGLRFESFSNLGTRHEQWVFNFEGNLIPVFGRTEFEVEKF